MLAPRTMDNLLDLASLRKDAMPSSAREMARLSLFDWFTVARAGAQEPVAIILRGLVADEAGRSAASVVGLSAKVPARAAALARERRPGLARFTKRRSDRGRRPAGLVRDQAAQDDRPPAPALHRATAEPVEKAKGAPFPRGRGHQHLSQDIHGSWREHPRDLIGFRSRGRARPRRAVCSKGSMRKA